MSASYMTYSNGCIKLLFARNIDSNMICLNVFSALRQLLLIYKINDSNVTSFRDRVLKYICVTCLSVWVKYGNRCVILAHMRGRLRR